MTNQTTKNLKLFRVSSRTAEFDGIKNVSFEWFRSKTVRERRAHYADLIAEYDPKHEHAYFAEARVEELFTEDEAKLLKAYLDEVHGDGDTTTMITEKSCPICFNEMGLSTIPIGGGQSCYLLYKERWYNLPFQVEGYFDLRGCEKVDGSGTYHGYHLVLDRDGMHRVENAPPEINDVFP
jgi:hypothetical protein